MKRSFKEIFLLSLCAILTVVVALFSLLRISEGNWTVAALDIAVVVMMLLFFQFIYITRRTEGPGIAMALIFNAGVMASIYLMGPGNLYWAYPAVAATFFLLGTRLAMLVSVSFMLCLVSELAGTMPIVEAATAYLTLLTTMLFSWSFAQTAKRQEEVLKRLATADPLTGAGNRRAQDEKLDLMNALFRRGHLPSSILILDVDYFKHVNDTHGHVIGDQILIELVDLIRANTRATESLYRYGGEEFIIIAENTGLESAEDLAEKLRRLVEQSHFVSNIHLTVSFGVAQLQRGEGRKGWLNRADEALFQAKRQGRNRVICAGAPSLKLAENVSPIAAASKS